MKSRGKGETFVPTCRDTYAGSQLGISLVMPLAISSFLVKGKGSKE
jgi:hypothetical protein